MMQYRYFAYFYIYESDFCAMIIWTASCSNFDEKLMEKCFRLLDNEIEYLIINK